MISLGDKENTGQSPRTILLASTPGRRGTMVSPVYSLCIQEVPTKKVRATMISSLVGNPMERIATDILGPLPTTKSGNKYILVVSDYFNRWAEAYSLPNQEASTIARILVDEWISRFGAPQSLHSDQGRNFESTLFVEMCQLLSIEKTRTTPYHPQSDGLVERLNRTLLTMLSIRACEKQDKWDEHLPLIMMAYRTSVHETTGFTPNVWSRGKTSSRGDVRRPS